MTKANCHWSFAVVGLYCDATNDMARCGRCPKWCKLPLCKRCRLIERHEQQGNKCGAYSCFLPPGTEKSHCGECARRSECTWSSAKVRRTRCELESIKSLQRKHRVGSVVDRSVHPHRGAHGSSVVDIGCDAGHFAVQFRNAGHAVCGGADTDRQMRCCSSEPKDQYVLR